MRSKSFRKSKGPGEERKYRVAGGKKSGCMAGRKR